MAPLRYKIHQPLLGDKATTTTLDIQNRKEFKLNEKEFFILKIGKNINVAKIKFKFILLCFAKEDYFLLSK